MLQPQVLFYLVVGFISCVCFVSFRTYPISFLHLFSYVQDYYLIASFSVARVSHDKEAKLSRERNRSLMGGIQGNGRGGGSGHGEIAVDDSRKVPLLCFGFPVFSIRS